MSRNICFVFFIAGFSVKSKNFSVSKPNGPRNSIFQQRGEIKIVIFICVIEGF